MRREPGLPGRLPAGNASRLINKKQLMQVKKELVASLHEAASSILKVLESKKASENDKAATVPAVLSLLRKIKRGLKA